jgi:glycosyltransferase involved in cell wall biosynthesis
VRIAIVDTLYAAFVAQHYGERAGLDAAPYADQHAALMARSFGTSDAYSVNLLALGHDAVDLLVNVEPLQRAWAREHGVRPARMPSPRRPARVRARLDGGLRRVARTQIAVHDAEVVYCQDLSFFTRADLDALRAEGRLVVGQIASAPPDEERLRGFDLILTSFPHYVERFRALGVGSEYFAIGFDERVLDRLRRTGVDPDPYAPHRDAAVFVGGVDPHVHGAGVERWERLLADVPFAVYGYGGEQLAPSSRLRAAWRGEAWGLDMYAALARAGTALNRHIGAAEGYANNMRLFEATGVGALLITESAPNLPELFEPGTEVVTYADEGELAAQLRHYLAHPDERQAIAAAGQRRTLADHTYATRMAQLADILTAARRS